MSQNLTSPIQTSETVTSVHQSKTFPFVLVQQDTTKDEVTTTKVKIAVGEHFVSEKEFSSLNAAEMYISKRPWEIIVNLMLVTVEMHKHNESES